MSKAVTAADRQYVIRACQMLKLDLIKPTRKGPEIIATHWDAKGFGWNVIDACNWGDARRQLDTWRLKRCGA